MLCACCAWADEVLELQPRLAEAAGAQGQAYVELRDRLVSTASTNALFAAVDDTRLEWRGAVVGRTGLESHQGGGQIPTFSTSVSRPAPQSQPDAGH